jgi:membrane fusion protein (multidrug efflux system)
VAAGDVLFTLDAAKEEAALAQARAEEEVAQQNLERARKLAGTRAISEQELDQLTSLLTARTAARQLQEERWRDMTISAPFAGTVGPRQVSVGQYVSPGQPLLLLVDAAQVKTSFRVPERHLAQLRVGQAVRLVVGAYTGRTFDGAIDLISPVVDEATRTVQVRAVVPNPEALLKPGMFARVEAILGQRPAALVIPEAALVAALDGFSVFVVADGRARLVPVQVGVRNRGTAEVREGLAAGQPIVVQGTQKLVDGMLVVAAAAGGTNGAAVTP